MRGAVDVSYRTFDSGRPGRVAEGSSKNRSFSEFSSSRDDGSPCEYQKSHKTININININIT